MHIYVNGRNIEITDAIKAYVKEKISKVANHYDQITGIEVVLSVIKNPAASGKHVAEVSCKMSSGIIHCKEEADSMYESIDLLADKLDRQVKKFKDKSLGSVRNSIRKEDYAGKDEEQQENSETEDS
ncbi:MAG: ribosome-associated translation inhibitor RaiA [Heliobacteriaceae bacterium]|jgi:putative sigma-54 modulation protein|nr:ribosome-associated translation inhibitor RaiA [Heliobacteriaceae bacterium]